MSYLLDLLYLALPETCAACGRALQQHEPVICLLCEYEMPKTNFHLSPIENPIAKRFWGQTQIEAATSFYYFSQGSLVQELIHNLKYNGRTDVGLYMGQLFGMALANAAPFKDVDLILPVPLHHQKKLMRGYNQSAVLAQGLAEAMQKKHNEDLLVRTQNSESQTRKTREQRLDNTQGVFATPKPDALKDKHVLLVDDVITTGATLSQCANALLQVEGLRVSLASIACTSFA